MTDHHLFDTSLPACTAIRATTPYVDRLDWSSEARSCSPDAPFGYASTPARDRRDFGCRNTKAQGRSTADQRLAIDQNFRSGLHRVCAGDGSCETTADACYFAVHAFGGSGTTAAAADAAGVSAVA